MIGGWEKKKKKSMLMDFFFKCASVFKHMITFTEVLFKQVESYYAQLNILNWPKTCNSWQANE